MSQTDFLTSKLPSHWARKKLKYLVWLRSGECITSEDISEAGEYPVFGGNGLRGYTSRFTHSGEYVLIGRQGALCGNINYASGNFWASEHAIVAHAPPKVDVRWLGELLASMNLNQHSQSAAQPGLAVDVIANLEIPVPPEAEQRAIALFIAGGAGRIDRLIQAKETLLKAIAEKRQALISSAVTRGIVHDVLMRDSLIPWLSDIPTHWKEERGRWLFTERDDRSDSGEETLLSLRMQLGLVPHNDVSEKLTRSEELIGYKKTSPGEIVLNRMRAASGLVAVTPQEGLVSPDYAVFRPLKGVNPHYFTHLFKTKLLQAVFRSESTGLGTGSSGFLRLYSDSFLDLRFPVPPEEEQRAIVKYVEVETARLDRLRLATDRTISLLKERRSALIAAAVTGHIRVGTDSDAD